MEQPEMHKISQLTIGAFMVLGIMFLSLFIGVLWDVLKDGFSIMVLDFLLVAACLFLLLALQMGYSVYLLRKRKAGKGFSWDDEGITIDLEGNKVYWNEIKSIQICQQHPFFFIKTTVIYPHYTEYESIRIRLKRGMPTPEHSIDWVLLEKPKEYHENLLKAWEGKRYKKS